MVENVIEVNSLEKNYGSLKAVAGISFEVKQGEVFSLLGPNGAGKTTTIEILEGLRERDGGDVKVLGVDPWKHGYELHRKLGVIAQGFRFFDYTTPKEAVQYYAALFGVKVDADAILKRVLLDDVSGKWYKDLSGGQKQKYGLALSLVNDPQLVVSRRAHDGPRPAGEEGGLGGHKGAQEGRKGRPAHHPLPPGGRRAGGQGGHNEPREDNCIRHA